MTMARLQRVYLYYSYAVFAVLLFTAWRQYQFALFLLLSFILLTCNAVMKRLVWLAKNRYADYASPMDATMPAGLLYGLIVLAYLLFSELLTNPNRFNWLLFAIWAGLILLPSLYFELQVNRFIAQSLAAIRQPEKWSAGKKLLWLLHGLVPLGMAAFSFYSAFTLHDHSVIWLKVGFFTLLIGIFIYRYLLLHLGFEAA
jgi:hypothetical protein